MAVQIIDVTADNLRGYTSTTLPLDRTTTLIVGQNNSGKTSVLRLLDWLMNTVDLSSLKPTWMLPGGEQRFLFPARRTRHQARRLTLRLRVDDGRSHRRFGCVNGVATLRLNLRLTPDPHAYLALGAARRGEQSITDDAALDLLARLRDELALIYVPSFRDANSSRFQQTLTGTLARRVTRRAVHQSQGGAPSEYREVRKSLNQLKRVVERLAQPLWPDMRQQLPPGFAKDANIELLCAVEDLVAFLTDRLTLTVSTGPHDAATVPINELGSGLQSLLDLAIQSGDLVPEGKAALVVVEEPESFLHPSAQRVVARSLLRASSSRRLVITTHSAVVVDEARYGEVVLCRDHRFYYPRGQPTAERDEINSALLSGQGAEMLFARSVLLVEGEGDRLFFEKLRRRIAAQDSTGSADELFVMAVGGKQSFGPWLRLLEAYGSPADRPIRWLVAADGDATADVRRAFSDAKVSVSRDVLDFLPTVQQETAASVDRWAAACRELNGITRRSDTPFMLVPVDLEYAMLAECSAQTIRRVADKAKLQAATRKELMDSLGSKAGSHADPKKSPCIRGYLGATLPWPEVATDIKDILRRWLAGALPQIATNMLLAKDVPPIEFQAEPSRTGE